MNDYIIKDFLNFLWFSNNLMIIKTTKSRFKSILLQLQFRLNEKSQAKLFTLYNPFGHVITYKSKEKSFHPLENLTFSVLCTATRNYTVNETTGVLQAKCCQDM